MGNFVYHLPLVHGFANLNIVHLEMVNIVMALHLLLLFGLVPEFSSNVTMTPPSKY